VAREAPTVVLCRARIARLLVQHAEITARHRLLELGAGLDGELVERDWRRESVRAVQPWRHRSSVCFGRGVDEVRRKAVEGSRHKCRAGYLVSAASACARHAEVAGGESEVVGDQTPCNARATRLTPAAEGAELVDLLARRRRLVSRVISTSSAVGQLVIARACDQGVATVSGSIKRRGVPPT
jgi:hypothetical protein